MAWIDPSSMLLAVDKPARSVDITGIANNSKAMADGDAGAPKIQAAALDPSVGLLIQPTTGTAVLVYENPIARVSTRPSLEAVAVSKILLVGGSATITATINTVKTGTGAIDTEAHVEVYKLSGIDGYTTKTILTTQIVVADAVNLPFSYNATGLANQDKLVFSVFGGSSASDPNLVQITSTVSSIKSGAAQNSVILF